MGGPKGPVGHAEFMIGNTKISISGESPESHAKAVPEGGSALHRKRRVRKEHTTG